MPDIKTVTDANRLAWDLSAKHHRDSDMWKKMVIDVKAADFSCLDPTITQALSTLEPSGKSVVQIGCNNGREILSLASLGATRCLGIDQSSQFIEQARELNQLSGSKAEFLCADIYNLPADTRNNFDIALITIGVLSWMPDLPEFFKIVAGLLAKNGKLVIYEAHPFLEMFDPASTDPQRPTITYFEDEPSFEAEVITYDGSTPEGGAGSYWYVYRVGQIINAVIAAGLQLNEFTEFPHSNREVDYDIYKDQKAQLPMCYVLTASKSP